MEWFSLWLPLVSQLVVPVSLLAWLAFGSSPDEGAIRRGRRARRDIRRGHRDRRPLAGASLVAPFRLRRRNLCGPSRVGLRGNDDGSPRPRVVWALVVTASIGALTVLCVGIIGLALAGRRPPLEPIDVAFPVASGTYLVRERRQPGTDQRTPEHA